MGTETQEVAILLVEDERAIREFVRRALQSRGYDVHVAEDGIEALAFFNRKPELLQLVVTDISMPRMNGIQLARELRSVRPDVPVLFISGNQFQWQQELGSDPILPKPFSIQNLFGEIELLLKSVSCGQ